jgi:hypothetical protein
MQTAYGDDDAVVFFSLVRPEMETTTEGPLTMCACDLGRIRPDVVRFLPTPPVVREGRKVCSSIGRPDPHATSIVRVLLLLLFNKVW